MTVTGGAFTAYLGAGSVALDLGLFQMTDLWLGIRVAADPEMTPRFQLGTTPYAGFAEFCGDANTLNGVAPSGFATSTHTHPAPAWSTITGVPAGFADNTDNDTTYTAGTGMSLVGTAFSVNQTVIEGYARGVCLDSEAELTALLNDNYAATAHTHAWTAITGIPAGFADGVDDGTSYTIGPGLLQTGNQLEVSGVTSPLITDLTIAAADLATGSVTSVKIADATIIAADLADNAVTSVKIADLGVATGDLADNAVTGVKIADSAIANSDLADNSVTSAKIVDATIASLDLANLAVTTAKIADQSVTAAKIANNTITGAQIATTANISAASYAYSTPQTGAFYVHSSDCQRSEGSIAPFADLHVENPRGNAYGPAVRQDLMASGVRRYLYCPVHFSGPPGSTVTITGATLWAHDFGTNCLIGAELRYKPFGSLAIDSGTSFASVFSGTGSADYMFYGSVFKPFPAFTRVFGDEVIWVDVMLDSTAAGSDCRFSGVKFTYTVDRP